MAKKKDNGGGGGGGGNGGGGGGCRPAHSRVSFLFQAAALLASTPAQGTEKTTTTTTAAAPADPAHPLPLQGMSRRLLAQMRAVSRKTNMRVRPAVKQRVCRYCDTLLVEGASCTSTVENASRGGRKPWADVLVVACHTCGRAARRYPVAATRQPRRPMRGDGGGGGDGGDKAQCGPTDSNTTSRAKAKSKRGAQAAAGRGTGAAKKTPG